MNDIQQFIGREKELSQLRTAIHSPQSVILMVYGRRRIGKSFLIQKAFEGIRYLKFEGLENRSSREQIDNFMLQLYYQTHGSTAHKKASSWGEAFLCLFDSVKTIKQPVHIVLDEFQWMANYRKHIVSDLKMVWDQYLSDIAGITLVLCGSIASFMIEKVVKSGALYGRIDEQIFLKPFHLRETDRMLQGRGSLELCEAFMITGGVPKYLSLLQNYPSIRIGIQKLAFREHAYFATEYERIFLSHFGRNPDFEKIIRILGKHPYGLTRQQLVEKGNLEAGGRLSTHINDLEHAGFISSSIPFHKNESGKQKIFFLTDAYIRFYFSFIEPHLRQIHAGSSENLFPGITQSPAWYSWLGRSFEYLCLYHARLIAALLGFSGIDYSFGPFFQPPGADKQGIQIDLLFKRADNVITLCEMKYTMSAPGMECVEQTERKVMVLQKHYPKKTIQRVLCTRREPSRDVAGSGYFYRVITVDELLGRNEKFPNSSLA